MQDENDNNEGEENIRFPPRCPVNKNSKPRYNTELSTALAILDRVLLPGDELGLTDSLAELKRILVNEDKKIWEEKQKFIQLMDENRRLRQLAKCLQKRRSSNADKNRYVLVTSNQSSTERTRKRVCSNHPVGISAMKNRIVLPTKTSKHTVGTDREAENGVFPGDNSESTIALASKARQAHGLHEVEYSFGGEGDLHKHFNDCTKNPGHLRFIPIDQFRQECLPLEYQDEGVVDCILALAKITVRVDVKSHWRTFGRKGLKTGTGWILVVKEYPIWYNQKVCSCLECKGSSTPEKKFAEILVYTAGHVVMDEIDGQNTTCRLFFDREGAPENCEGVKSLSGATRVVSDLNGDRCEITFATHDLVLADRLYKMVKLYRDLNAKVCSQYMNTNNSNTEQTQGQPENKCTLAAIVSHPHGCSKQVSIGHYTRREELDEGRDVTKYTYTTATCQGSSGAPVFILGKPAWGMCEHPHSAISEENEQENTSGYGLF